jgi:hypothetical protein
MTKLRITGSSAAQHPKSARSVVLVMGFILKRFFFSSPPDGKINGLRKRSNLHAIKK